EIDENNFAGEAVERGLLAIDGYDGERWGHAGACEIDAINIALGPLVHVGRYSVGGKEVGELRAGRIVLMHVGERNAHGVVDRGELWLQLQRSLQFAAAFV